MWVVSFVFIAAAVAEEFHVSEADLTGEFSASRIIGGNPTVIEKYPYTVQVLYEGRLRCGGSLITQRHVLSAAHCFVNENDVVVNPNVFSVRVGSTYLSSGGTVYSVSMVVVHEGYNRPPRDNDVAVLVLGRRVATSAAVATVALPHPSAVVPSDALLVHVGWGSTHEMVPQASDVLNEVVVRKVNRSVCAQRYRLLEVATGEPYPVTGNMICAGLLDVGGKDACQGDSGGPLLYGDVVVGVTSWGYGCGQPSFPGVSARVASFTRWVESTVGAGRFVCGGAWHV
ncbi:unnamed protein product, partial [Iphiclides podalirius]